MNNSNESKNLEIEKIENATSVEEKSYIFKSNKILGVTNDLNDILAYIEKYGEFNDTYVLGIGEKEQLLDLQNMILIQDALRSNLDNINTGELKIPKRFLDYNLVERVQIEGKTWQELLK